MKTILSDYEHNRLEGLIKEAEEMTGAQIVMALIRRSDHYPEIPWKAFALGSSLAALGSLPVLLFSGRWITDLNFIIAVSSILVIGAAFALLTLIFPGFARLFVPKTRLEVETQQYANSLFLDKEVFTASGRRGVLLMASLFEKQIVILPDLGLTGQLNKGTLDRIIIEMVEPLRGNRLADAMETGLKKVADAIGPGKPGDIPGIDLPDEIIEEEGV